MTSDVNGLATLLAAEVCLEGPLAQPECDVAVGLHWAMPWSRSEENSGALTTEQQTPWGRGVG